MRLFKAHHTGRVSAGLVLAAAFLLLGAGQASADNGSGTFTGLEYPPAAVLDDPPGLLCATFDPAEPFEPGGDPSGPLVQVLSMAGTFHAAVGTGTATFTGPDAKYDANPLGTYEAESDCATEAGVAGTMDIEFEQYDCSGDATYERRNSSHYTVDFEGTCDDTTTMTVETTATTVAFSGVQVPCSPLTGCVTDSDASSDMAGIFQQTH